MKCVSDKGTKKHLEHRKYKESFVTLQTLTTKKISKWKTSPSSHISTKTLRSSPTLNIIDISVYLITLNHR